MQEDRDYLIHKVFPRIQAIAERRDVSVVPLDLRWGITEDESRSGKVIEVCLQEIENSRPFFIGLIGNRYGWCPSKEELRKNKLLQERWGDWLEKDIENGLSITEIEMQYGVFRSKDSICAHFFIKQSADGTDENDSNNLRLFKQVVRNNGRYPVYNYHNPEELGEMIEKAFIAHLDQLFPEKNLSDEARWHIEQQTILHQYMEVFIPKEDNLRALDSFAESQEQNYLIIHGNSGTGKSALIAQWCKKHESENVIYHFVGSMGKGDSFVQIQKRLCYELCEKCNLIFKTSDKIKDSEYKNALVTIYRIAAQKGKFTIAIDGIDKLPLGEGETIFDYLPVLPSANLKYIFTSDSDNKTVQLFRYLGYQNYQIHLLSHNEKYELIVKKLKRYGKNLSPQMVNVIASHRLCENLFVLTTLLEEIVSYGKYETLNERIAFYLEATSEPDFYQRILKRYETDFSSVRPDFILSLINLTLFGFTESEILELTGLKQLHFSQFFCAFHKHFQMKNGRLRIAQRQLRDAIKARYADNERNVSRAIVSFFNGKKTSRAYEELSGQYFLMEKDEALYQLISDVWVARQINDRALGAYWQALRNIDKEKYSMNVYLREDSFITYRLRDDYCRLGVIAAHSLSDYNTAVDLLQQAWNAYKERGEKAKLGEVNMECAEMCRTNKTYQFAITYFKIALDCFLEVYGQESREVADVYNGMGLTYSDMGECGKAMDNYVKAQKIYLGKYGKMHSSISTLYNNIARTFMEYGSIDHALHFFEEAISIEKSLSGNISDGLATMYNNIGMIFHQKEDYAHALFYYKNALESANILWGGRGLLCAHCHSNIGSVCLATKKYETAENEFLMSIKILSETVGEGHYETAKDLNNLGIVYHLTGQLQKASQCYHSAINILERRMLFKSFTGEDYTQELSDIRKRLQIVDSQL